MRLSQLYMPTLREAPADAEIISHKLMLRSGMIRKSCSGIYSYLPLGFRVLRNIEEIVRRNMDEFGGQEIRMSVVQPAEIWQESGRWEKYGPEMFKVKDRNGRDFCLGPTAEEYFTSLVKDELTSYKSLPLNIYQIQIKYRDEKRPRFGLNRSREFLMKDAYSFDRDPEGMAKSYHNMENCYDGIFTELGLEYVKVDSDSGQMGGNMTIEFQALSETGEGELFYTENYKFAATDEKCEVNYEVKSKNDAELPKEKKETPGCKTIEDVAKYLNKTPDECVKAIAIKVKDEKFFIFIPGDRELNMTKFQNFAGVNDYDIEMMSDEDIVSAGSVPGYMGPFNLDGRVILDKRIKEMKNVVVGANEEGMHFVNVNFGRDFDGEDGGDLLMAREGDMAPDGSGELKVRRGIEVGQIFGLGTKYSESLGAGFLDEDGVKKPFWMGSYGVGISRTITAIIEQNHDDFGIIWPINVAPYEVIISVMNVNDEEQVKVSEELYKNLSKKYTVLIDDRSERAGVKFNDRDLIGIPLRITVGKGVADGVVEFSKRVTPKDRVDVKIEDIENVIEEERRNLCR